MAGDHRTLIFVDNSVGLTGGFKSMKYLILELKKRYNIVLVTPDASFSQSQIPGIDHYELAFVELRKDIKSVFYPFHLYGNARQLNRIIQKYPGAILHMNDFYNLTGCVVKLLHPRIPLVYHVRLLPTSYLGPVYSFLASVVKRFADRIVCCSQSVYDAFPASPDKLVVYDALPQPEAVVKLPANNPPSILYPANYTHGKGQDRGLMIMKELVKINPDVKLRFLGDTFHHAKNEHFKQKLMEDSDSFGLSDRVFFAGFCPNIDKEIRNATILLNCSESESFSMVCLEGLLNQTCVVTLNSGGPSELIKHEKTGLIFNPDTDNQRIAQEINSLLCNPDKQMELTRNGYLFAQETFSLKKMARQMEDLYDQL